MEAFAAFVFPQYDGMAFGGGGCYCQINARRFVALCFLCLDRADAGGCGVYSAHDEYVRSFGESVGCTAQDECVSFFGVSVGCIAPMVP